MTTRVLDQQTLDGIKHLIQEMGAQKKHCIQIID